MSSLTMTSMNRAPWVPPRGVPEVRLGQTVCAFLDTATTSMGRATHYNTREEQQGAELKAHEDLLQLHRGLYTALLTLPGLTDRSQQIGLKSLLSTAYADNDLVGPDREREIVYRLLTGLPATRMLRAIEGFRVGDEGLGLKKANNARTRKLILRTLLGSPRLSLWAVKYRRKVRGALVHAWGQRKATAIREALRTVLTGAPTNAQRKLLEREVWRYANRPEMPRRVVESVAFALGVREADFQTPILKAFDAAKRDLTAGKRLPLEVLEGIRGTYHREVSTAQLLELVKDNLTKTQKKNVQAQAARAGVEVDMDPLQYDAVTLYVYAFERGATAAIQEALVKKAMQAAKMFPARHRRVGLVVDASGSMVGHKSQRLRPMAATLALRDMLVCTADQTVMEFVGGNIDIQDGGFLVKPEGHTALANALVGVLEDDPDVVYVLSDGYENAPAGRFAEVVKVVRKLGVTTPIYHLNPVYAAEAKGVRQLASDVPLLPAPSPAAVGTGLVRAMIEAEPTRGINRLLDRVLGQGAWAGPDEGAKRAVKDGGPSPRKEVRA